jgi:hypothetical protein
MTGSQVTRRWWLVAGLCAPFVRAFSVQSLMVRRDGDRLHITAPELHFLSGKPLEQLKNGSAVAFASQLTLAVDSPALIVARILERFVVSYDLWEEKFKVTKVTAPRRSASNLSSKAAENWCIDNLMPPTGAIPPQRPFWIKLELRAEDSKNQDAVVGEPGINLTRLIELFSRPPRSQQPRWVADAGPLRLTELK